MNTVYNSFRKIETIEGFVKPYYNCYNRAEFSYGYDESRTLVTFQSKATSNDPYIETHKKYYLSNYEYYVKANQDTKEVTYISTRNGVVAAIINETNQPERTVYVHKDYLGSIQSLSEVNSQGNVVIVAEFSFDAWGRARSHTDWDENFQSDASVPGFALLERGFTGHEHIIQFGIINMNARLYDPIIASFLSPDDIVSDPENPQNYNRFSYALNNPMRYTDPSGNDPFLIAMAIGAFMGGASYALTTPNFSWNGLFSSIAQGAISGAISYGVGAGFGAVFGTAAPGTFASLLSGIGQSITGGFITSMVFEGKYTGSSALQSVAFSFVNWGIDAMSSSSMNEGEISNAKSGKFVGKPTQDDIQRAEEYNASVICKNDTKQLLADINSEFGIKNTRKISISTEVPTNRGYGMTKTMDVIAPDGEIVLGNAWKDNKINVRIYHKAIYNSTIIRHELIHAYHYYRYSNFNRDYSESAAYNDSYMYSYKKGDLKLASLYYQKIKEFSNRFIPFKPYESDFNKMIKFLKRIR